MASVSKAVRADKSAGIAASVNRMVAASASVIILLALVRSLDSDDADLYLFVHSAVILLSVLGRFGIPRTIVREVAIASRRGGPALAGRVDRNGRRAMVVPAASALLVLIAIFAVGLGPTDGSPVLMLAAAGWLTAELRRSYRVEVLRGLGRVVGASLHGEGLRNLSVLIVVGLLEIGDSTTVLGVVLAQAVIAGLISESAARRAALVHADQGPPAATVNTQGVEIDEPGRLRSAGSRIAVSEVAGAWLTQGPVLLASILIGAEATASVAVAMRLGQTLTLPLIVANQVWMPLMAGHYADGTLPRVELGLRRSATAAFAAALVGLVVFMTLGPVVLTRGFDTPDDTLSLLLVVSTGQLISAGCGPCVNLLQMTRHHGLAARIQLMGAVVFAALGVWSAVQIGVTALVVVSASVTALVNLVTLEEAHRVTGVLTCVTPRPAIWSTGGSVRGSAT